MSSGLLADNRTAHEERIISAQPSMRQVAEFLVHCVIQAWFSTEMTSSQGSTNAGSAIAFGGPRIQEPLEPLGGP